MRAGITYQGAFLNVCPAMQNYGYVDVTRAESPFGGKRTMGCLVAERRRPARMTEVRAALVESLADAIHKADMRCSWATTIELHRVKDDIAVGST